MTRQNQLTRALNILVWKRGWIKPYAAKPAAEYIVAELADKGIFVKWNDAEEQFEPSSRRSYYRQARKT
jgi:hypothetical protein